MKVVLLCAAALAVAPLAAIAQDAGSRLAASCAMCHGTGGHSVGGNAALAGTPRADLVRKMKEFQSGARPATAMHQIAKGYTDSELEQIAAYFAAQKR
jgi:cytochrome c553